MENVLFIAYYFPPIAGAGVQRVVKFVRYLPEHGYHPVVVTGPGTSRDYWSPSDPELEKDLLQEIPIYRIRFPQLVSDKKWQRRMNAWFCTPSSFSRWWIPSVIKTGEEAILKERARIIISTMSPFESARAASALSNRFRIPWIADLRDPWALDEMKVYPSRIHRKVDEWNMYKSLSSASAIIMNTPEATDALIHRFPDFKKKIIATITNGYDGEEFESELPPQCNGKFRIVHSGYLHTELGMSLRRKRLIHKFLGGAVDGVDILTRSHVFLLNAISRWIEEDPFVIKEIELIFMGVVTSFDQRIIQGKDLQKVIRFTGYVPHLSSVEMIRTSDLLFLPMHNLPPGKRSTIIPGKTYEYMATGKPILATVPDGDAKEFLEKSGMAYICKPNDQKEILNALKCAYRSWKEGKREKVQNREYIAQFERKILTKRLAELLNGIIGNYI